MKPQQCTTLAEFLAVEAHYYGPPDAEQVDDECIEDYCQAVVDDCGVEPIEVVAYRRHTISEEHITRWADSALECVLDGFDEEYGNDDEATEPQPAHTGLMRGVVAGIAAQLTPWRCEAVAQYTLTEAEVREMDDD